MSTPTGPPESSDLGPLAEQFRIAEQHYQQIPADLRNVYEDEYTAASDKYREKLR